MRRVLVPLLVTVLLISAGTAQAEDSLLGPLFDDSAPPAPWDRAGSDAGSDAAEAPPAGETSAPRPSATAPNPEGKTPDAPLGGAAGKLPETPSGATSTTPPGTAPPGTAWQPHTPPEQNESQQSLPGGAADSADADPGPGRMWTMTADRMVLEGSRFHGVSRENVAGNEIATLHFTAQRLRVTSLEQRSLLGNGRELRVASAPGKVSTVSGPVRMRVRKLSGTLNAAGFPLAPVTLSAQTLSPANVDLSFLRLPRLTFDDVTVRSADLRATELQVPGADISLEPVR